MKKAILKVTVILLAGLMVAASFTGCSKDTQPTDKNEKVTLNFLYWADGVQKQLLQNACTNYEKKTGVTINAEALPADGSFDTYIQTRRSSNTLPDISYMGETDIMKYDAMGILADISDMVKSGKISKKLDAVTIKNTKGKIVGVGLSNQLVILYYNKDMFDKAGLEYPPTDVSKAWSWDKFVTTAKKLTIDAAGKHADETGFNPKSIKTYGVGFNCLMDFHQYWALYANGGGVVSADGKNFLWDSQKSIDGLQKVVDLMQKDHVASQALFTFNSSIGSVADALGNGGYAMYTNGSWDLANLPNVKNCKVGVGVLPKMEKAMTMNCGAPMVVYNTSKHISQAKDFYAYMVDPNENLDLLKTGAWLPNETSWYTDKTKVSSWTSNLPKDAADTILSYSTTNDSIAQWPAYYVPAYSKMDTEYGKYIDEALTGKKSVSDVYASCMPKIKQLFQSGTVD